MANVTLDSIVTGILLKKRYPIHFYVEFLTYAASGMRELSFDSLKNIRAKKIPINTYGAIPCPCDYMDWIKVGIPNGQYIRPLSSRPGLNRLNNFDTTGTKIPYTEDNFFSGFIPFGVVASNSFIGGFYGNRGDGSGTFLYVKERNEIQINVSVDTTEVILEYISDGTESDNATKINPYAIAAIEAYCDWQETKNKRGAGDYAVAQAQRNFDYQHGKLRGRINGLTAAEVKYIWNRNTHGSLK